MATKAAEKSNFSRTCSLLSRYLKEKGGIENLRREMACSLDEGRGKPEASGPATAMDLLPKTGYSKEGLERKEWTLDLNAPSADLSPPGAGSRDSCVPAAAEKPKATQARPASEAVAAQLTMFYAGRVVVFDDFPAERVKELMLLASKSCFQNAGPGPSEEERPIPSATPDRGTTLPLQKQQNPTVASTSDSNLATPNPSRRPSPADGSDLPIARKNSLHRFLEKRKDRISTKGPYPAPAPQEPAVSTKREDGKLWLGLASSSD